MRVDRDHLMRAQRRQQSGHGERAAGANVGRAVDRDVRRRAGIVQNVADTNEIGCDGNIRAQRRRRSLRHRGSRAEHEGGYEE